MHPVAFDQVGVFTVGQDFDLHLESAYLGLVLDVFDYFSGHLLAVVFLGDQVDLGRAALSDLPVLLEMLAPLTHLNYNDSRLYSQL